MKKALFAGLLIAALALIALGCSDGGGGGGGNGSPYYGTSWETADGSTLSFVSDTEWQMTASDGTATKGTYTYSGGSITLTPTHTSSNFGAAWTAIPAGSSGSAPFTVSVSGDTIEVDGEVFDKQDGGGGSPGRDSDTGGSSPYYRTVWETVAIAGTDISMTLSFVSDTGWQGSVSGEGIAMQVKGTYTYSGDSITFRSTHRRADSGAAWTAVPAEEAAPATGIVVGDAIAMNGVVLAKRGSGAGTASPYYGTAWIMEPVEGGGAEYYSMLSFVSGAEWLLIEEYEGANAGAIKGTYTYSGSSIIITPAYASEDSGVTWEAMPAEYAIPIAGTVSGDTLTIEHIGVFSRFDGFESVEGGGGYGPGGDLPNNNPYWGTAWESTDADGFSATLTFVSNAEWRMIEEYEGANTGAIKGTYTYSGSSVTCTVTHVSIDGVDWLSVDLLEGTEVPGPFMGTVSGDTLTLDGVVFTKQG